jgi:N-acetylglucosaminyl-diphospho-decaprenol L-rhamnosyltransferase
MGHLTLPAQPGPVGEDGESPAEIAVIIINYGTAALAVDAVESVLSRHHGGRRIDVHLVDNASPGADAADLARVIAERGWDNAVTFHREAVNHGFGRGNNLVLRKLAQRPVPPRFVLLLNPDARLENEVIDIMARFLDAHPHVGFAGAGTRRPDGTRMSAAFRFPNPIDEFASALNFGPVARLTERWQVAHRPNLPQCRVAWVAGAAVLARFEALIRVDFFDPAYFLYYEEVDLMRRAAAFGWQVWHLPEARVAHVQGAATGLTGGAASRSRRPAYWYASWRHYFAKHHGRTGLALALVARLGGTALNHALCALRGRQPKAPRRHGRDICAAAWRSSAYQPAHRDD